MGIVKLDIYKGFNEEFLLKINEDSLISVDISQRLNVLNYDKKTRKSLIMGLLAMEEEDHNWITYEEFSLIRVQVESMIDDEELEVRIIKNNLYPEYYPIQFEINETLYENILSLYEEENNEDMDITCKNFENVYSGIYLSSSKIMYGAFYNYENDSNKFKVIDFYPSNIQPINSKENGFVIFSNVDAKSYIEILEQLNIQKPKIIAFSKTNGQISRLIEKSVKAWCIKNNKQLIYYREELIVSKDLQNELIEIAKKDIKIPNFQNFRYIPFYRNPDINKEIVNISQGNIISDIINQAENAYNDENRNQYRDIFITASTGAGKSIMFQIPAIYLAKKYNKLTIIIEPVKALMQDQKEQLVSRGYTRVEAFNSDLITQVEKERVLNRVKNGEVDLLYMSPETLLAYSIDTIIGDREIGLMIIDEAHIVTTWGVGFRPDYWYLGTYINRLRHRIQTYKHKNQRIYHFPLCAFTATAINGGIDDSVSETIISLYMINPIKYIGKIKREDIDFKINVRSTTKLPTSEYENKKAYDLSCFLNNSFEKNEKSVVYFPYATHAKDAYDKKEAFSKLNVDNRKIGQYTGRNTEEISTDLFNKSKQEVFEKFRTNKINAVYATKAFGMGVDINDINNVYHYAVSGNLSDYIQEIGRAARKKEMKGIAYLDYYLNDMMFMQQLFGMSQIRQWQIKKVLSGIYEIYKSKRQRNFLISPQAFTYIFQGKSKDDNKNINKLKTCLMMLEKDINDKNTFDVIITRPQSVFTKAFVVISDEHKQEVFRSKYANYFKYEAKGRSNVHEKIRGADTIVYDVGDIYTLDLKGIWEDFYQNLSFPQFKYWYFNTQSNSPNKVEIMPEVRRMVFPRQRIIIRSHHEIKINEIRKYILEDMEKIKNDLYETFENEYFTLEEFSNLIAPYENMGKTKANLIANSLFDIIDPSGKCISHRRDDSKGTTVYRLKNGTFGEIMRKAITKANIIQRMSSCNEETYSSYISMDTSSSGAIDANTIALKLLSIFDYITYEIAGGEEPEIFIRLNDPVKIEKIVTGGIKYTNDYVTKAKQKHERDVEILKKFFLDLNTKEERWNYVENYFLGENVLEKDISSYECKKINLETIIDVKTSFSLKSYTKWKDIKAFMEESYIPILKELSKKGIPLAEYLSTIVKGFDWNSEIIMSWPTKNIIIFSQDISNEAMNSYAMLGIKSYRIFEIDYDDLKERVL